MYRAAPVDYGFADDDDALTRGVLSRRVVAWMIDAIILAIVMAGLWVALLLFGVMTFGLGMPLLAALPVVPVLYGWLSVASSASATPGQAIMGVMVRRNEDLGPPGGLRALATTILFYVTLATSLGVLWFLVVLITARRRTLHDILSGTVVVRASSLTAPEFASNMGFSNSRAGGWPSE